MFCTKRRCPDIPVEPICGSDMRSYQNKCNLREAICSTGQHVSQLHDGMCKSEWHWVWCTFDWLSGGMPCGSCGLYEFWGISRASACRVKNRRQKLRGMAEIWPLFQVIIENSNERWGKICHHSSHYCWTSHQVRRILLGQHIWKVASYIYIVLRPALI